MATNPLAQEMTPAPTRTQVCLLFPENTQQEEQGYNHQVFVETTRKHFKISLQQRPILFHTLADWLHQTFFSSGKLENAVCPWEIQGSCCLCLSL